MAFSSKVKNFEIVKKISYREDNNNIVKEGRYYNATDATIEDIEADEKEAGKYYDMILTGTGDRNLIISTLQDCQKRYKEFISCLKRDFYYLKDLIAKGALPFVVRIIFERKTYNFELIIIEKTTSEFMPECWEILYENEHFYNAKWKEESYYNNLEKILGREGLSLDGLASLVYTAIDICDLSNKAEKILNDSLNPLIDRLIGKTTNETFEPSSNEVSVALPDNETDASPVPKETPIDDNPLRSKPYWDKLSRAFINFPKFEEDYPILVRKEFIKESEEYEDRLQWNTGSGALAFYFNKMSNKGSNWKTLEKLFTDKKGNICDGSYDSWRVQLSRPQTYAAKELFEALRKG